MTRKEGIIKQWADNRPTNVKITIEQEQKLLTSEYMNYVELCSFCMEKPLIKSEWLEQKIIVAK